MSLDFDPPYFADSGRKRPFPSGITTGPLSGEISLVVTAEWHVMRAQNAVRAALSERDFSSVSSAYIVTAISELATNLFFHATGVRADSGIGRVMTQMGSRWLFGPQPRAK